MLSIENIKILSNWLDNKQLNKIKNKFKIGNKKPPEGGFWINMKYIE